MRLILIFTTIMFLNGCMSEATLNSPVFSHDELADEYYLGCLGTERGAIRYVGFVYCDCTMERMEAHGLSVKGLLYYGRNPHLIRTTPWLQEMQKECFAKALSVMKDALPANTVLGRQR